MSWKKILPTNLLILSLLPSVLAQDESVVKFFIETILEVWKFALKFFFGEEAFMESNILLIKFGFWIITFAILFWVLTRANIIEHKASAGIIAAVVAMLGIKFMPNVWVLYLTTVFRFIVLWVVIIIMVPYLLVTRLIKTPGWPRRIILAIIYVAVFFGITNLSYFDVGSELLDEALSYVPFYSRTTMVIGVSAVIVIGLWLLNRLKRMTSSEYEQMNIDRRQREMMAHQTGLEDTKTRREMIKGLSKLR